MNLYQTTELAKLEHYIDHDTGEIDIEGFNNSQIALKEKQLAVVAWLKNNDANITLLDGAIKELQARKKAMQSRYESLKDYLLFNMKAHGVSEISANDMTFTAKIKLNPPSVIVEDESLIPKDYMTTPVPPPPAPDKQMIKAAFNAGIEIPGCKLVQAERVEIK
jgi:restriction endonuclease S subunit